MQNILHLCRFVEVEPFRNYIFWVSRGAQGFITGASQQQSDMYISGEMVKMSSIEVESMISIGRVTQDEEQTQTITAEHQLPL